jgi:hypothetical protein
LKVKKKENRQEKVRRTKDVSNVGSFLQVQRSGTGVQRPSRDDPGCRNDLREYFLIFSAPSDSRQFNVFLMMMLMMMMMM